MKNFDYSPKGVCSRVFHFVINDDNKIENLVVEGGCNGNLKGIACLLRGMDVNEAIVRMEGITCGMKSTSCPDQLTKALTSYLEQC